MKRIWALRLLIVVIAAALAMGPVRFAAMAGMPPAGGELALVALHHGDDCEGCADMAGMATMASCLAHCAPSVMLSSSVAPALPHGARHWRQAATQLLSGQHPPPQGPPPKPVL